MAEAREKAAPARAESGWVEWLWRWTLLELGVAAAAVGVLRLVQATRVDPLQWIVFGMVALIIVVGFVLAFRVQFWDGPVGESQSRDSAWERLSHTQRRGISRALRRGDPVDSGHHVVAIGAAERSIRVALPQATIQTSLTTLWLINGAQADRWGNAQTVAGLIFATAAVGFTWWVSRLRRSLTRLRAQQQSESAGRDLGEECG